MESTPPTYSSVQQQSCHNVDIGDDCHTSFPDNRETLAWPKNCARTGVFKRDVGCACYQREACFNAYKLLLNHASYRGDCDIPLANTEKRSHLVWFVQSFHSHRNGIIFRSSSHAIAFNKRTRELKMVGTHASPESGTPRCLNPRETSLIFAFITLPSS